MGRRMIRLVLGVACGAVIGAAGVFLWLVWYVNRGRDTTGLLDDYDDSDS